MPDPTPTEEVSVGAGRVVIPASWAKLAATVLLGMLLGGAGASSIPIALSPASDPSEHTSDAELKTAIIEVTAADARARESLATAAEVQDVLWLVCQLAARAEPPITDRRCSQ